jgi:hypothetical protein
MSAARDFRIAGTNAAETTFSFYSPSLLEGMAMVWTRRVTAALLAVQEDWVRRPPAEREQIKTRFGTVSAFPHCVGFVKRLSLTDGPQARLHGIQRLVLLQGAVRGKLHVRV